MVDVVDITGAYPYATCFVCKEMGHISRECPKVGRAACRETG